MAIHHTMTALTAEANELEDHADFCESLVSWNLLDSEAEEETPAIQLLRLEALQARKKAEEVVGRN